MQTHEIAETAAIIFTGLFFCFKFVTGYLFINLSLEIRCERKHSSKRGWDLLVVFTKLKKGDRGSLSIHDAQARITYNSDKSKTDCIQFRGFERSSYTTEKIQKRAFGGCGEMEKYDREKINWNKPSESAPLLRLTPGEETEYACVFEVPQEEICLIEVAIIGRNGIDQIEAESRVGQWKASSVSLPI